MLALNLKDWFQILNIYRTKASFVLSDREILRKM